MKDEEPKKMKLMDAVVLIQGCVVQFLQSTAPFDRVLFLSYGSRLFSGDAQYISLYIPAKYLGNMEKFMKALEARDVKPEVKIHYDEFRRKVQTYVRWNVEDFSETQEHHK